MQSAARRCSDARQPAGRPVSGESEWRRHPSRSTFLKVLPTLPSRANSLPERRQEMPTPAVQDSSRDAADPVPGAVRSWSGTVAGQEWKIHHGPALDVLKGMDPETVDCMVTSPPYF